MSEDPFSFYFDNEDIDLDDVTHYSSNKSYFEHSSKFNMPVIALNYPRLNRMEFLQLDDYSVDEVIDTVHFIMKYCVCMTEEMKLKAFFDEFPIKRQLKKAKQKKDFKMFANAIQMFNVKIKSAAEVHYVVGYLQDKIPNMFIRMNKGAEYLEMKSNLEKSNVEMIEHIYEQSYNRIIEPRLNELNKYQAFSDNVYGEINLRFVERIIEICKMDERSVFVDLGSGIGNVVCQMAGLVRCDSYGIEVMQNTADLSFQLRKEFNTRMFYYNQPVGNIGLYKGDIMNHPQVHTLLKMATVVFVNNYVFNSQTNQSLQQHFLDLQDGTYIISMKSFAQTTPLDARITARNVNHIESILHCQEEEYFNDYVSWSDAPGNFFVHVVDREPLRKYNSLNDQ
eukprot:NODE_21_length_38511_cov_0.503306.p9 type:complete len:394 gc:universal NODE_21_length_38511_cov_0.503306:32680-31499(-)